MENYINQLLGDIAIATANLAAPVRETQSDLCDWISDEDEEKSAPVIELEKWTGISREMLPPSAMLNDDQLLRLLEGLKKMLDAYNWSFVMQISVPERIQYETIRQNFDQPARRKRWTMGFFEYCRPGTPHGRCTLGEYCHCALFADMFKDMIDEELTAAEERARDLEIEVQHIKRKYSEEWMKYYPYHLDKNYDDEEGNPYNYGFDEDDDSENDDDNWWRR